MRWCRYGADTYHVEAEYSHRSSRRRRRWRRRLLHFPASLLPCATRDPLACATCTVQCGQRWRQHLDPTTTPPWEARPTDIDSTHLPNVMHVQRSNETASVSSGKMYVLSPSREHESRGCRAAVMDWLFDERMRIESTPHGCTLLEDGSSWWSPTTRTIVRIRADW